MRNSESPNLVPSTVESSIADSSTAGGEIPVGLIDQAMGSVYSVSLDFFSGPMDLLLHLVSQQEVSIAEVKMAVIAEQYLKIVLDNTHSLDLDRATEYLVIASTLMAIKSRSLLPVEAAQTEEDLVEEFEESRFFEDLRARLIAYQTTKVRALELMRTPQLGVDTYLRVDRKALLPTAEMLAEPEDGHYLAVVFASLLKRIGQGANTLRIALEPISVVSYMMRIVDSFTTDSSDISSTKGSRTFRDTLRSFELFKNPVNDADVHSESELADTKKVTKKPNMPATRSVIIGSFVAVLELVKRGLLSASQNGDDADITLELSMEKSAIDVELDSEFDQVREEELAQSLDVAEVVDIGNYIDREASRVVVETVGETEQDMSELRSGDQGDAEKQRLRKEVGNVG